MRFYNDEFLEFFSMGGRSRKVMGMFKEGEHIHTAGLSDEMATCENRSSCSGFLEEVSLIRGVPRKYQESSEGKRIR